MAAYGRPVGGSFSTGAGGRGGHGERIADPAEIRAALERAVQLTRDGTPVLLEFMTEKETELSRPDLDG